MVTNGDKGIYVEKTRNCTQKVKCGTKHNATILHIDTGAIVAMAIANGDGVHLGAIGCIAIGDNGSS